MQAQNKLATLVAAMNTANGAARSSTRDVATFVFLQGTGDTGGDAVEWKGNDASTARAIGLIGGAFKASERDAVLALIGAPAGEAGGRLSDWLTAARTALAGMEARTVDVFEGKGESRKVLVKGTLAQATKHTAAKAERKAADKATPAGKAEPEQAAKAAPKAAFHAAMAALSDALANAEFTDKARAEKCLKALSVNLQTLDGLLK